MIQLRKTFLAFIILITSAVVNAEIPRDGQVDIWSHIPFFHGADICRFEDGYGQTRQQFMDKTVAQANSLMQSGAMGFEALQMLLSFNAMYDQIRAQAVEKNEIAVTLEANLNAFMDRLYQDIRPRVKRVNFLDTSDLKQLQPKDKEKISKLLSTLDYMAYGTYAYAPGCNGTVQVTLHLVGRNGRLESFVATDKIDLVMSQISNQLFTAFQRTHFPSTLKVGRNMITLLGGLNASVDFTTSLPMAEMACSTLDGRLPTKIELEMINMYGDWSGGVSLGHDVWALPDSMVYAPDLKTSPVRMPSEVNATEYRYICVK